ncbi:MAG: polysaccharide biosynthesis protein [Gemmataceae bacterium]
MSRAPILFRCDATPEAGYEGYYQCLVMASAMQRRRRGTYFFSRLDPLSLAVPIHRGGHEWVNADDPIGSPEDLDATLREVRRLGAAAVVVADPNVSEEYIRELDASGVLVVVVDADAKRQFTNRLVINPYLGLGREDYSHAKRTQLLLGERYPLIRPLVRRLRPLRAMEPAQPFRCLLALGDDDPAGHTLTIAGHLLEAPKLERVDVYIRSHHPQRDELKELAASYPGRLDVITENPELSTRVSRCHFAVTAGDGFALELACVGVPQLMTTVFERHRPNAVRLDEEGVATDLGLAAEVTAEALYAGVETLLSDRMERQGMSRCGRQLIDGRGPDRLVTAVEVMLAKPQAVTLKIAA